MCYVNKVALIAINATFNIRKEDIRKRKIENFFYWHKINKYNEKQVQLGRLRWYQRAIESKCNMNKVPFYYFFLYLIGRISAKNYFIYLYKLCSYKSIIYYNILFFNLVNMIIIFLVH